MTMAVASLNSLNRFSGPMVRFLIFLTVDLQVLHSKSDNTSVIPAANTKLLD